MSTEDVERGARKFRAPVGAAAVVVICVVLVAALAYRGWDFYQLSLDARLDHEDFRLLSPGEILGHGYGIVGTALIFTNLLYLVRRKLARWPLGPMRVWLDLHVVTGLVGSILVVFHSAFQLRTPIATVTSVSLLIVVVTGVVGRYLYALVPKTSDEPLRASLAALEELVKGLGRELLETLSRRTIPGADGTQSLIGTLATVPSAWTEMRARRRIVLDEVASARDAGNLAEEELVLLKRGGKLAASLAAGQVRAVVGANLLRTWRGLHRLLALLMILSVSVHIGVAWFYGYRWIWSE